MMQTAESRHGDDLGAPDRPLHSRSPHRGLLVQPEMRSVAVVITDVLVDEAFQMAFVQNDHVIEQIATASANSRLSNAVLRRALMPRFAEVPPRGKVISFLGCR